MSMKDSYRSRGKYFVMSSLDYQCSYFPKKFYLFKRSHLPCSSVGYFFQWRPDYLSKVYENRKKQKKHLFLGKCYVLSGSPGLRTQQTRSKRSNGQRNKKSWELLVGDVGQECKGSC